MSGIKDGEMGVSRAGQRGEQEQGQEGVYKSSQIASSPLSPPPLTRIIYYKELQHYQNK